MPDDVDVNLKKILFFVFLITGLVLLATLIFGSLDKAAKKVKSKAHTTEPPDFDSEYSRYHPALQNQLENSH